MNEELHSTNEELESTNVELRQRSADLDRVSSFLESIIENHPGAVAVLDRSQVVQMWNARARDLWGLYREEATGKHFLNLDIGLPTEPLLKPIRKVLSTREPVGPIEMEATDRRGRRINVMVTVSPVAEDGVIVFMDLRENLAEGSDG